MKYESSIQYPLIGDDMRATSMDKCLMENDSSILSYLSYLGVHNHNQSTAITVWCRLLTFIYAAYFVCFTVEFVIGIINQFSDMFWVMCAVMMLKCAVLYVALMRIRLRLSSPVFKNFLVQVEDAIYKSKNYFYVTIFFNLATIVLNIITKTNNGEVGFVDIYFYIMLAVGSTVFTCYMAAVILFSVADARVAQDSMKNLIRLAEDKQMTPELYIDSLTGINKIVDESFWLDGALISCIIMNTLAAIVLLFIYNDMTQGESTLYTVSFILYILMIMWITDLVFLFLIVPEIAKVNDLFIDFHRALARAVDFPQPLNWGDDEECGMFSNNKAPSSNVIDRKHQSNSGRSSRSLYLENRNNTLHLVVSEPIRYTIAGGLYLTTRGFWHRVLAVLAAFCFSVGRVVFLFIVST